MSRDRQHVWSSSTFICRFGSPGFSQPVWATFVGSSHYQLAVNLKVILMAESIAVFASINFMIIGLSHIFQAQAWQEFFKQLHTLGRAGALANGMLALLMGSLIVSFHNIWTGLPVVLTLVG